QKIGSWALSSEATMLMTYPSGPGPWPRAARILKEAREQYPPDQLVLANSVEIALRLNEVAEADELSLKALEIFPASPYSVIARAGYLAAVGRCVESTEFRERALIMNRLWKLESAPGIRPCTESSTQMR